MSVAKFQNGTAISPLVGRVAARVRDRTLRGGQVSYALCIHIRRHFDYTSHMMADLGRILLCAVYTART